MALLTVLTPIHPTSFDFLGQAWESLAAQRLPPGWDWEWVVQVDGLDAAPPVPLADRRVHWGSGPEGGPSAARNLGLGRATGSMVRNLDADDQLLPGALAQDVQALDADPTLGWVVSAAVDTGPDGVPLAVDHQHPPAGRVARGTLRLWWSADPARIPVHPTTVCARRDLLLALGGWMGMPSGGDTGLLLALDAVSDGWFIDRPSVLYRKHADQVTAREGHARQDLAAARRDLALRRAEALSGYGWRYPPRRPPSVLDETP